MNNINKTFSVIYAAFAVIFLTAALALFAEYAETSGLIWLALSAMSLAVSVVHAALAVASALAGRDWWL